MSDTLDFVSKLFDTLKEASKDSNASLQTLITQQQDLVNHVKGLPVNELQQALKDHDTNSKGEIDACTETVETKTDTILTKVNLIDGKISKMIIVVIVTFSLFTGAALIGKIMSETKPKPTHDHTEVIEEVKKIIDEKHK